MDKTFETKDSGERQVFETGMHRDTNVGKARYDLVDMHMLRRIAELMGRGAVKYDPNNWRKAATQAELDRFRDSAFRHFVQWFTSDNPTEDHGAAVFFNIAGAEYVRSRMLDDGKEVSWYPYPL